MSRGREPSRRALRIRGRLLRAVGRIERHPLLLGLGVAAVGGVIAIIAALSVNGVPFQNRYEFSVHVPGDTPPLKAGDQVRVAGKLAGLVTKVTPGRDSLRADVKLYPQFAPVGRDARVHIGVVLGTSLAYLVLRPGDARGDPLPEGAEIPAHRVSTNSSLPQALEAFDKRTREAIAHDFDVLGRGAIGQGARANAGLLDLRAVATDGGPILDALTPPGRALSRTIAGAARTTRGLRGQRPDDVAAGTEAAPRALAPLAEHSEALGENFDRAAAAEREALATLPPTQRALDELTAGLADVEPATRAIVAMLADSERLFSADEALRRETRRFGRAAQPLLRQLAPAARALIRPAKQLDASVEPIARVASLFDEYEADFDRLGDSLVKAFSYKRNGVPVLRASGSIGCHRYRTPFPQPGEAFKDRRRC